MSVVDIDHLRLWIGKQETRTDLLGPTPPRALAATLDRTGDVFDLGSDLPPPYHWLYFLPLAPQSQIGPDGHPLRGGFLPPVPLPRRMWAGGCLHFTQRLKIGDRVARVSEVLDVRAKEGRSGPLVFVKVRHVIGRPDGEVLREEQDLVYRDDPKLDEPPPPEPAPAGESWTRDIRPDPVLLFRFSALTFNAHRIHYDRPYAVAVERYPGLVVHGPLLATLLLDLLRRNRPEARITAFTFRAVRPVFDGAPFTLCGRPDARGEGVSLWVKDAQGALCMDAAARLGAFAPMREEGRP